MKLSEARVFEMMGRLHAENRALTDEIAQVRDENAQVRAALEQHRCPATEPAPVVVADAPKKKAR